MRARASSSPPAIGCCRLSALVRGAVALVQALCLLWWLASSADAAVAGGDAAVVGGDFATRGEQAGAPRIEVFVREGCPHCAQAEAFLSQLAKENPALRIDIHDVLREPQALARLQRIAAERGIAVSVPVIRVNGRVLVGFSEQAGTDEQIRRALLRQPGTPDVVAAVPADERPKQAEQEAEKEAAAGAPVSGTCGQGSDPACSTKDATEAGEAFTVTFFGRTLSLDALGLPLFAVTIGLLDGFNPCSMWVLVLMISLLAPLNDRRRMLAIAGTFVVVEAMAYFAFMAAWLNVFLWIGLARTSQLVIAAIAIVAGLVHVKDFWLPGRGFSLSIPEQAKPGVYARMRRVLQAPSQRAAIAATIVLALLVQLVELLCTSGLPALFTRILTLRQLEATRYYGYLLLYNLAYMLDDLVVLAIGVVTLSRRRLHEKEGRWLQLLSGVVMLALGVYLIAAA